jgi:hypothetical protein
MNELIHERHFEEVKGNVLLNMQHFVEHPINGWKNSRRHLQTSATYGMDEIRATRHSC